MRQLLYIELYKLLRTRATLLAIAAVLFIDIVALGVAYAEGQAILDFVTSSLQEVFYFDGNLLNGNLVSYLILNSLWFHLPFIIIIVSVSFVASEYSDGSMRNILCRPVRRDQFIVSKYLCIVLFSTFIVLLLASTSLGLSFLLFGSGDLLVFIETLNVIPAPEAIGRLLGAFAFGCLSMASFGLMAGMLATYMESPVSANIAALFVLIVFTIVDSSGFLQESILRNLFIIGNASAWQEFFRYEIPWAQIARSAGWLIGYCFLFSMLGLQRFKHADITC